MSEIIEYRPADGEPLASLPQVELAKIVSQVTAQVVRNPNPDFAGVITDGIELYLITKEGIAHGTAK